MTRATSKFAAGILTAVRGRKQFAQFHYSKFVVDILLKLRQKGLISSYRFSYMKGMGLVAEIKYSSLVQLLCLI